MLTTPKYSKLVYYSLHTFNAALFIYIHTYIYVLNKHTQTHTHTHTHTHIYIYIYIHIYFHISGISTLRRLTFLIPVP